VEGSGEMEGSNARGPPVGPAERRLKRSLTAGLAVSQVAPAAPGTRGHRLAGPARSVLSIRGAHRLVGDLPNTSSGARSSRCRGAAHLMVEPGDP
jgi:hypothetical protein